VLSTAAASGQPRTDVVTLVNGDTLTGEIVHLDRGRLELKTDHAGTIDIDWVKVATATAARHFEITTADGRRFLGSLGRGAAGHLTIADAAGSVWTVPMPEVTGIVRIGASFWSRLDGSFDVGFSYTRASAIAQTTVNSSTVFRRPAFALRLDGAATLTSRTDGDKRDDQSAVEFSYARYRGRRGFVSGGVRLESNESLGLVLRSQVGGVAGVRLVNTNRAQLQLGGGVVANREQGVDAEPTTNAEGVVAFSASFYRYDRPKTNLDASAKYYPSLSARGRQRLQVDGHVKREILKNFTIGLNGYYTLDTDPPNPDAARNDLGLALAAGWTY
jgi:hypothetical protein